MATARHAVAAGLVDMVGMTRAHMADPQIVNKLRSGREEQVRPCVGASHCLYRPVNCIHNPATGRETWLPQVIERSPNAGRKAVVIGGGPAGLEAARVLAERGHRVVLFKAAGRLGGQIVLASRVHLRRNLVGIIDWRVSELERLGVDRRLNLYADIPDVLAEEPDLVVVATGGVPDFGSFEGSELCLSVSDALGNPVQVVGDVLIYDATGRHPAPSAAAEFAASGKAVTFVARDPSVAPEMEHHSSITYRRAFAQYDVRVLLEHELVSVSAQDGGGREALLRHLLTGGELRSRHAYIIVEHGTYPVSELFEGLRPLSVNSGVTEIETLVGPAPLRAKPLRGFQLHLIGDAISSRSAHAAMLDALRLCIQF